MKIKNIILAIICMGLSTTAFAVDQTWEGSVGWKDFTITSGESTVVDLEYQYMLPGYTVSTGAHYRRTDDDDNIVGVMSTAGYGSFSLKAVGDWNITDEDNMDIDDFEYTGTDFGADYAFKVTERVTVGIDYKVPYDSSFNRQESVILFSLNLSLDRPTSTN